MFIERFIYICRLQIKTILAMELQLIQQKIFEIRGYRVMMDYDLAKLYEVETKELKRAVKRNITRFPSDFMFELSEKEYEALRYQFGTSNSTDHLRSQIVTSKRGGNRYLPFAFTEQGVAMLSGILRSPKAIEINIAIMRAFVLLRELTTGYTEIKKQLDQFMLDTNLQIADIYDILNEMALKQKQQDKPRNPVGYVIPKK